MSNTHWGFAAVLLALVLLATGFGVSLVGGQTNSTNDSGVPGVTRGSPVGNASEAWNTTYDLGGDETVVELFRDGSGYVIVGNTEMSRARVDSWAMRIGSAGDVDWFTRLGGTQRDAVTDAVRAGDGYLLAGSTESFADEGSDGWLVVVNSSGGVEWRRTYGGEDQDAHITSVAATGDGYVFAGHISSAANPQSESDYWLGSVDSDGDVAWNRSYGDGNDEATAVAVKDGILVAGVTKPSSTSLNTWLAKTALDGTPVWNRSYGGELYRFSGLLNLSDGFIASGVSFDRGGGFNDMWVVRTDANGSLRWSRSYGGSTLEDTGEVIRDPAGGFVVVGWTASKGAGARDAWLLGFNEEGRRIFDRIYGGEQTDMAAAVLPRPAGGYLFAGSTNSYGSGSQDIWLVNDPEPRGELGPLAGLPGGLGAVAVLLLLVAAVFAVFRVRRM